MHVSAYKVYYFLCLNLTVKLVKAKHFVNDSSAFFPTWLLILYYLYSIKMMCRQVLPDATDNGIEQIYIVKTEPGLEDDGGLANMVPEMVDEIKTEPKFEDDEEENENLDDEQPDEIGFEKVDVIVKEEPKLGSDCESKQDDKKIDVRSKKSAKDRPAATKGKTKPKAGKKKEKKLSSTKEKVDNAQVKDKLFDCSICGKKINNEYNLQKHLLTHDTKRKAEKEKELTCQICGNVLFSKYYLKKHLEGHEKKAQKREQLEKKKKSKLEKLQRFVCHYCPRKFTTYFNLRRHEDLHDIPLEQQVHKRKEFFCYVCDQDFGSKEGIQEHLYTHADQLPYSCKECDKPMSIKSVRVLNQHLEMHKDTTNGSVKCAWCPQRFHSLKDCKLHERSHVNEGSSALEALERRASVLSKKKNVKIIVVEGALRYACDLCDKSYTLLDSLRDHMNTHTDSDKPKKLHVCTICNEVFAFAGGLHSHRLVHSDLLPYKCEYCDKGFKEAARLISHRQTHTGERPFVCECGLAFGKRFSMMSHKKICLSSELLASCSCRICGNESFPSYADLIKHVTGVHTEPIPRTKCQFCPALSRNALLLVRHEHRHQMLNVIKCDQCNRIFKNKALLEEHEVTHINKPLSFICDICGMTFNRLKRLQKHKKNHTKVRRKPAKLHCCDMCPKKFSWLGNFRSHQKLHYNEKSRYFIPSLVEAAKPEPVVDENEDLDFGMLVKTEME
ncbi:oocyte zinc finger protein XlCOF6-like isoform X2 [Culex pipiens pallens]|uniref:oocyte zinc finger protein XlCOF6-like isoform X2 n=1 Tax=Culex pipiens pallens TaxID=42434 RepID=UPI00195482CD|nr:oocyte zinc finger protein XlCOF6-like isoform X2 [Culex pipiens pallens]